MNKVARITALFWIMKILATTLGETAGDLVSMTWNVGYLAAMGIIAVAFLVVLVLQLRADRYHASIYWLVIVGTTTLGTEISDFMDRSLGTGYTLGSAILLCLLLGTLFLWRASRGKIVVYPIRDRATEAWYWAAILFSNSLGTAFGDYLSDDMGLSFLVGAAICAAVIGVVLVLHYRTRLNEVLLFWIAFVFTRPFGATFGDFLTKPHAQGGLALGTQSASLVEAALLGILVGISINHTGQEEADREVAGP